MDILCHRGLWREQDEHNTTDAFRRAWQAGFGVETDIRDRLGVPVVSHDPAGMEAPVLEELLSEHAARAPGSLLALNVKADGLARAVARALSSACTIGAFVFDMSVPDGPAWLAAGVPIHTRHSELERSPAFYAEAAGVWLDALGEDWWGPEVVEAHLAEGKRVSVVSPELHGREHLPVWRILRDGGFGPDDRVSLCTDRPVEAREFFG